MFRFHVPDGVCDRETLALISTNGISRTAVFDTGGDEDLLLEVVGWALVLRLPETGLPQLSFEPVVDDPDFGPISAGDFLAEGGALDLKEIE
ncbi:hypothetical protein ACFVGM_08785 [Kitasatospora purpeofusca]|uniref:hypothetical protein n=1 Tax=Kitasatospora purpeofusca TaxID=67352 RepID=UPI00367654CD